MDYGWVLGSSLKNRIVCYVADKKKRDGAELAEERQIQ